MNIIPQVIENHRFDVVFVELVKADAESPNATSGMLITSHELEELRDIDELRRVAMEVSSSGATFYTGT